MKWINTAALALFISASSWAMAAAEITIYTARKIITMEPALPEATAVAMDLQ